MRFKIDWASLIVAEGNFLFLFCFTLYLRPICKYKPLGWGGGAYIWRGEITEGFLHYKFGGLMFGGAYFRNFTVCDCFGEDYSISLLKPS